LLVQIYILTKEATRHWISITEERRCIVGRVAYTNLQVTYLRLITVGAPELCRGNPILKDSIISVQPSIDTWSFGAVLSVTLVWCARGKLGVDEYYNSRLRATENIEHLISGGCEGCFHDGEQTLDVVFDMHKKVRSEFEKIGCSSRLIQELTFLAEDLLAEAQARLSDQMIHRKIKDILESAKRAGTQTYRPRVTQNGSLPVTRSQLRNPPHLPSDSRYLEERGSGREISDSKDAATEDMNRSSLSPIVVPSRSPLQDYIFTRKDVTTVTAPKPNRGSTRVRSDVPVPESSASTYPNVTIKDTCNWISRVKSRSHKSFLHPKTIPQLPGEGELYQLDGRDQVASTAHS
jgi:hypothetical protein